MDPLAAIRGLHEHGVRFVLIGGQAARARGSSSLTQDVDICYDPAPDNLDRLETALHAMYARERDDGQPTNLAVLRGEWSRYHTDCGPLDLHRMPPGTTGYPDLIASADRMNLGGFDVDVVALDDLIRMKRAAGRPKDRIEVEVLIALRDEITESS